PLIRRRRGRHERILPGTIDHKIIPRRSANVTTPFSGISPHFRPRRHRMAAPDYRAEMILRFAIWEQVTGVAGQPTTA
ncbi:hypothetical protein ACF1BV_38400, partial [Streptomyces viridosporus]